MEKDIICCYCRKACEGNDKECQNCIITGRMNMLRCGWCGKTQYWQVKKEEIAQWKKEGRAWQCDDCRKNIKCKCYPNNNCEKCLYKKCTTKDKDTVDNIKYLY